MAPARPEAEELRQSRREFGDDPDEDDQRDAVADAARGDLLAQPHQEHRAADQGDHAGGAEEPVNADETESVHIICNYQVYFCSGRKHGAAECGQRDLEAAIIRLDAIDVVGTVRRYDEWLALAEAVLRQHAEKLTLASAHHNRSRPKSAISEAEILERLTRELGSSLTEELLQRNELDMCLHQVADALLTRRLAERSVAIMLRESYAEARETALRKSPSSQP